MKQKTLVLLCDNYPFSAGEFFIDDEMRVIAPEFDKVLVYTALADAGKKLNRFVPENAEVVSFSRQKLERGKSKSIFRIFKPMFIAEFFFALKKLPLKYWLSAFKIMYVDMHRATNLKKDLVALCKAKNLDMADCVFYSYWHDYKALALVMLRKGNMDLKCVARAHGWDNFADRHVPPYLPFKLFIINNLSRTYSISNAGKNYFEYYLNRKLDNKVIVSRLGKFNDKYPNMDKRSNSALICSCSNLISIKRVDKIIEVLSLLNVKSLHWVHFGDGSLREELLQYAQKMLPNVQYEFKGIVPNNEIMDFYAENYVDLFINLSSSEGIPVSIMEALSAGIPVLATNVGGTSEAVNSNNGFLIPANFDCSRVAQIIDNYLDMSQIEQQTIRRNAYEFWKDNYEAGRNYNEFINDIKQL
ncbi:MAG: glycosyltransferase [Bacteroidales bacterium]|nr:glycosyltransferase [Bacteroidales bacterium]